MVKKPVTILPAKPKRARTCHVSLELESNEDEWEDKFRRLDIADEVVDMIMLMLKTEASFCMVKTFTPNSGK